MAITQANFILKVAAYINRTSAELVYGSSLSLVLDAMNMVKLGAQRKQNFKMCRKSGFISTSIVGAQMTTTTSDFAGTTPMTFKYFESMWIPVTNGTTTYRGNRVPAMTVGDQKLVHGVTTTRDWTSNTVLPPNSLQYQSQSQRWFQHGTLICVNGVFQPITFWIDGIAFLPDYDGTTGTDDFFLTYYHDWLFVATLDYMNLYLKEDQRVAISTQKMTNLWNDVVAYDEQFSEGAFDLDENN